MGRHVVVGFGQVGTRLARVLRDAGHDVAVVTRSGRGLDGVEPVAADVAEPGRLARVAAGADAIYNCVNPPYHRWPQEWPPMARGFLDAAQDSGAVLVILGNLYAYGAVDRPMTEDLPLSSPEPKFRIRATVWEQALAAHREGRIRAVEVRGSDFYGPGATDQSYLGQRFVKPLRAGKTVRTVWPLDVPHSFSYLPDVADALAIAGRDERAWGRAWHVPTAEPMTFREIGTRMAAVLGRQAPAMAALPWPVLYAAGWFNPMVRELRTVRHQFTRPYILDSSAFQNTFDVRPTPTDVALKATVDAHA